MNEQEGLKNAKKELGELLPNWFYFIILGIVFAFALEFAVVGSSFTVLLGGSFGLLVYIAFKLSKNRS